jgi:hypothetical protein
VASANYFEHYGANVLVDK